MIQQKNPTAVLLNIGTELLTGKVLNSNAQFLAEELDRHSFPVIKQTAVRDDSSDIFESLTNAALSASIIIVTGGLGPTFDDITTECIAQYAKTPLYVDQKFLNSIKRYGKLKNKRTAALHLRQSRMPLGSMALKNRIGVAQGFLLKVKNAYIAALPGVPSEMKEMVINQLLPRLDKLFPKRIRYAHKVLRFKSISEPQLVSSLPDHFFSNPKLRWGIYPMNGHLALRVYFQMHDKSVATRALRFLQRKLSSHIYAHSDINLEESVGVILAKKKYTVSIAESITGGGVGEALTNVPGASRYFLGGIVAYANEIKIKLLGVRKETIQRYGAVSKQTAIEMACRIQKLTGSDYSLSVTGIAGPLGATRNKPIGLVHIAIANRTSVTHKPFIFRSRDRDRIRQRTVTAALSFLFDQLKGA